ncbi:MAG TPA: hypothetical protein VFN10_12950 [Thermoanaerobaculia bacterium]|nr:hypothetical protein [Thermoanaerobaculia bacterium]
MNALRQLYDEHAPHLYALALRITGDRAAAAEVLADVFLRASSGESYGSLVALTREIALGRQSQTASAPVSSTRELPAPRRLVEQAFFAGMKISDLAGAWSLPEAKVRELLCTGMAELRGQFTQREKNDGQRRADIR